MAHTFPASAAANWRETVPGAAANPREAVPGAAAHELSRDRPLEPPQPVPKGLLVTPDPSLGVRVP